MIQKKHWLFCFLLFTSLNAFAQWKDLGASVPSPNAASLGVYGEIPVSQFTGVPEISIPLYEVKGNKINLPISLSYHAGGLHPEVHPSWVGNGWSLMVGGMISRKVNGIIDETQFTGYGKTGYYYNYADLASSDWSSAAKMDGALGTYPAINASSSLDADIEPDEFSFNFLNYSGKFFLDQNGNWQVQCDKYLKVLFDNNDLKKPFTTSALGLTNMSYAFLKFTIVDEMGNKYIFGSSDANNTAVEFSDRMVPTTNNPYGSTIQATSWSLTQIISADGSEVINLNYERGPLTSQIGFSSAFGGYRSDAVKTGFNWGIPSQYSSSCASGFNNGGLSGWIVFPIYLTSISMPSQSVTIDMTNKSKSDEYKYQDNLQPGDAYLSVYSGRNSPYYGQNFNTYSYGFPSQYLMDLPSKGVIPFYTNNSVYAQNSNYAQRLAWLKLDAILVKNAIDNSILRKIVFNYTSVSTKRLQLNSINIQNSAIANIQNYSFGYNTSVSLPNYLATYTDHWGFNNNMPLPDLNTFSAQNTDFYQYRSPDATGTQTQAEILNSITYPTGSTSTFSYEPNTYSAVIYRDAVNQIINNKKTTPVTESGTGGGLRISQIISSDGYGNTVVKKYYYVKGYHANLSASQIAALPSSGVLDSKPVYNFMNQGYIGSPGGAEIVYQINSSNPVIPTTSNSSSAITGYTSVVEQRSDGSYKLSEFTNHDNGYADQMPIYIHYGMGMGSVPPTSFAFERGKLLHQSIYAVSNTNTESLVSEQIMTYMGDLSKSVNTIYESVVNLAPSCGLVLSLTRSAYQMYYYPFLPATMTTKTYSSDGSGNYISQNETYNYDNYRNLIQVQKTNSKGQNEIVNIKYPYNFSTADVKNPYAAMVGLNEVSIPIEKTTSVGGRNTNAELHTYKLYSSTACLSDENYQMNIPADATGTALQVTPTVYDGYSGKLTFDSKYNLVSKLYYDPNYNVSTIEGRGGSPTALLWNYNKSYLTAKVSNAYNVSQSGAAQNNTIVQTSYTATLKGTPPFSPNNFTLNVAQSGTVKLTFQYLNQFVTGNNSTTLSYSLNGVNPSTYTNSGSLCAATTYTTNPCTNNTISIANVPAGTYTLTATISSVTGFSNYYNYGLTVQYPSYQYAIVNAKTSISYTSFETSDYGNFTGIVAGNVVSGTSVTGNKYYNLTAGSPITYSGMIPNTTYIVSYWSKSSSVTVNSATASLTGKTKNGWTYYENTVANPTTIAIAVSTSANIDEVRIFPSASQMTTYTYDPTIGLTSQCDANGKLLYYEYDSLGRLITIRDEDKNIIKKFCYNYAGAPVSCN